MTEHSDLQVLLVEDSPVISQLIASIINDVAGLAVVGIVDTEADAIEAIGHGNVDVVILDLQLRIGTGFGVLRALRSMPTKPVVVVLTNFAFGTYQESALSLGAQYFLDKSRDYDRLPEILTNVAAGLA